MKIRTKLFFIMQIFILLLFSIKVFAQLPQYYNYNTNSGGNAIPFGFSEMRAQYLIGPGEFNQPSPAPTGNITKLWFRVSSIGGSGTYTNLSIKLTQDTITTLPLAWYSGQYQTVYFRSNVTIPAPPNTFIAFVLDTVFSYNPALSLIIDVVQCGGGSFNINQTSVGPYRRNYGGGPCPQAYFQNPAPTVPNCGIDITFVSEIKGEGNQIPVDYSLSQNYPNPFNPKTIINYQLPSANFVRLAVYDLAGKEITLLVNGSQRPGTYSAEFDGSSFASGIYFYSLTVGDFKETKKMILMK